MNPLEKIDECLKENVLNLWEPVHELIEHSGECGMIDFWAFIPEHEQASCDHTDFTGELTKKYGVPFRVLQDRLFPQEVAQEKAITRLYMAIGFVLGLRLAGASEDKIKQLMATHSFGLKDPEK
jgi:hypothetical protein